jgi:hypothetical protein
MTATEGASTTVFKRHERTILAAIGILSIIGAATTFYFYKRYADVWLRSPPRMPSCVLLSRRLLSHEDNVSGSIPHMAPDGSMVYLRRAEDRAVTCLNRLSSKTASVLAAAFAEVDPDKRARALAAIEREHVSAETSADAEALATYLITAAAVRALPKTDETDKLRSEMDQRNACRFSMRTPCPTRPPIPTTVWMFGAPSSVGIIALTGWGSKALTARLRAWWKKRRAKKSDAKAADTTEPTAS